MHTGRCACGSVVYEVDRDPMFVHCCHCRDCQRLSGAAYALNGLIETSAISVTGELTVHDVPSPSGHGQRIRRCALCGTAIMSHYLIRGEAMAFLKIGTLDDTSACPPDVQIYTSSAQGWVPLWDQVPVFEEYYDVASLWPEDSLARRRAVVSE